MPQIFSQPLATSWPQWLFLGLYSISILTSAILDGQPKSGTHSFLSSLVLSALGIYSLHVGGFW